MDALLVRDSPGLSGAIGDTLPAGWLVEFDNPWGPVVVDGIGWMQIGWVDASGYDRGGFVAAGSGGDRYLELLPPRCLEGEPDLAALQRITAWERLACFGGRSLTVTGTYGCPVCGIGYHSGSYAPDWLANPDILSYLGWPDVITLHFPPEGGLHAPPNASIVRVAGHFSDPASTTCVIESVPGQQGVPVDPIMAELYCREQVVVDAYEIIGTDPEFSPGG